MTDRARPAWATGSTPELRTAPPWVMEEMVVAQRELAAPILAHPSAALVAAAVARALETGGGVEVTGCGTSEHAARGIAALIADAAGDPGAAVARQAFEVSLDPPRGGLLIAVTHEGGTAATVAALEAARRAGATTCLVTAASESAAHAAAELVYPTPLRDASWCHTVGYVSPLLAGGAVAAALGGSALSAQALAAHLAACDAALAGLPVTLEGLADAVRLVIVGSGVDAVSAAECALKVEEGAWLPCAELELEELLHGHLPAVDARCGVVAFLLDPRSRAARAVRTGQALAAAAALGAPTVLVSDVEGRDVLPAEAGLGSPLLLPPPAQLGLLGALLAGAVALQRTTLALAAQRGTNPDLLRRDDPRYREAARRGGSPVAPG